MFPWRTAAAVLLVAALLWAAFPRSSGGQTGGAAPPSRIEAHEGAATIAVFTPDGRQILSGGVDLQARLWDAATGRQLQTFSGHTGPVFTLAVSPDGRQLATGSQDNSMRLWDIPQHEPIWLEAAHEQGAWQTAVSPNQQWLVSGGADRKVRLWDVVESPPVPQVFDAHLAGVTAVDFRADNAMFASGDAAGIVQLWSPYVQRPQFALGAHRGAVRTAAFLPNNQQLLTGGDDGAVKLWQLNTPSPRRLPDAQGPLNAVAIARATNVVATAGDEGIVRVHNLANGQLVREIPGAAAPLRSLAISPNAALMGAGDDAGRIRFWQLSDGADRFSLAGHVGAVNAVDFQSDNLHLASAGADGSLRIWQAPAPLILLNGHSQPVTAVAGSADSQVWATVSGDKTLRLWNPAGQPLRAITLAGAGTAAAISPDGALIASGDAEGRIQLWNVADGAPRVTIGAHSGPIARLDFVAAPPRLVSTDRRGEVKAWRIPPVTPQPALPPRTFAGHTQPVTATAFARQGQWAVTASADATLRVWNVADGQVVRTIDAAALGAVRCLAITRAPGDLQWVVAGGDSGLVAAWNLADGQLAESWECPAGAVTQLSISEDSKKIATGTVDGVVRVWETRFAAAAAPAAAAAAAEPPAPLVAAGAPTTAAAVSRDGTRLAVGGAIGGKPAVVVYDLPSGKVLATLMGHLGPVTSIGFSPSGDRLASGAEDKTCRVWNLKDPKFPELGRTEHPAAVRVAAATDGDTAFSASGENALRQWSIADGKEVRLLSGHGAAVAAAVALDEKTLYTASADGTARAWTIATGAAGTALTHGTPVTSLCLNGDGKQLVTGAADGSIKRFTVADGKLAAQWKHGAAAVTALDWRGDTVTGISSEAVRLHRPDGVALDQWSPAAEATPPRAALTTPDGTGLWLAEADGAIHLEHRRLAAAVQPGPHAAAKLEQLAPRLAFLPDGRLVIAAAQIGVIAAGDWAAPATPLPGSSELTGALAVSLDGRWLAASSEKTVRLWDLQQPAAAPRALIHEGVAGCAVFSPDSQRLIIGADDKSLTTWSCETGARLERLESAAAIAAVAAHPSEPWVLSGAANAAQLDALSLESQLRLGSDAPASSIAIAVAAGELWTAQQQTIERRSLAPAASPPAASPPPLAAAPAAIVHLAVQPPPTPANGNAEEAALELRVAGADAAGNLYFWERATGKLSDMKLSLEAPVASLQYSADGRWLLTADARQRVRLYDAATLELREEVAAVEPIVAALLSTDQAGLAIVGSKSNTPTVSRPSLTAMWGAHAGGARDVVVLPDQQHLASGGADKLVKIWRRADGELVRTLEGHEGEVTSLAVTPDGQRLLSGSVDGTVCVWNVADGEQVARLPHAAAVIDVTVSPDGLKAIACVATGEAEVWSLAGNLPWERFPAAATGAPPAAPAAGAADPPPPPLAGVVCGADNRTLVAIGGDEATIHAMSGISLFAAHQGPVLDLALIAGGGQVATCGADGVVATWTVANGQQVRLYEGLQAAPTRVAARLDNARLAAGDAAGRVLVWNTGDGSVLSDLAPPAASPANPAAAATAAPAAAAPAAKVEEPSPADTPLAVTGLAYSPDNQKLTVAAADGAIRWYGPPTPPQAGVELVLHLATRASSPLRDLTFSADNRQIVACNQAGAVSRWAYASPVAVRQFNHGGPVYGIQFTPDGQTLVSCSADQTLRLWNVETGAQRAQLNGHQGPVYAVAISADGALAVSSGADKTLRLWDLLGARQLKQLVTADEAFYTVAIHPQGKLIAAAGADRQVHLYDLLTGVLQKSLVGHQDFVHRLDFHPKDPKLLSYGYAGELFLWNLADGKPLYSGQLGSIGNTALYSPDGARIVAACGDGSLQLAPAP